MPAKKGVRPGPSVLRPPSGNPLPVALLMTLGPDRVIRTAPGHIACQLGVGKEQTAKEENKQTSGRNEQNKQTVWRVKIKPTNGRVGKANNGIKELTQTAGRDPLWTKGGLVCSCVGVRVLTADTGCR